MSDFDLCHVRQVERQSRKVKDKPKMPIIEKTKVIIAGGRDFDNYDYLEDEVLSVIGVLGEDSEIYLPNIEIVSGGAQGADFLGERFASRYSLDLMPFPADWVTHGKAAGPIRNNEMADYADILIAFWDGESKGTKHMIQTALNKGLEVHVFRY